MSRNPDLRARMLIGALAGIAGAVAVTAALRKRTKPQSGPAAEPQPDVDPFYAAACGSLLAAADVRAGRVSGVMAAVGILLASTLGWLPGIARSSSLPAKRRNLTMIGAHLLWGISTVNTMRELLRAREKVLPDED